MWRDPVSQGNAQLRTAIHFRKMVGIKNEHDLCADFDGTVLPA
jgi:hypothetical protein